ncbi:MAG TPA: M15 family metallopeptidase [Ilumatobacter sp.]|nr:M15 family metallopeptidase [Ilumatobacter sp.]
MHASPRLRVLAVSAAIVFGAGAPVLAAPAPDTETLDDTPYTVPVPPPKCTQPEVDSGNVGGCLLFGTHGGNNPDENGWGVPPAPGVGDGWVWTGNTYRGSPALAEFESTYITANTEPLGNLRAGSFEMHTDVRQLFEGFLGELVAGGYAIRHASGYSFRCTREWNCSTRGFDGLSLHAWGLAFDMNSDANPIRTYHSKNGVSACLTPIATDLPEWAIRAAERWGIYWGGYGWNSGCNVAGAERSSVERDTPHFEFRGSPQQARAIAQYNYANNPNLQCFDTVTDDGTTAQHCNLDGLPDARTRLAVSAEPPAGATAALVNLTAVGAASAGYLTLESCAARDAGPRETSSITYAADEAVATLAIVPLDGDRFCVYRASAVHSIVDMLGYLVDGDAAGDDARWVSPTEPTRLLDTRDGGEPLAARTEAAVAGTTGDVLVNLAAVPTGPAGYLQAGACGVLGPDANFSNVNYAGTEARSNLALVRAGDAEPCVFSLADADVVVDALATLDPADGLGWEVTEPRRALDTRERDQGRPEAGELIELDLDITAPAAVVALTVTQPEAAGYLSVGRCDDLRTQLAEADRPATSNLNHAAGQTVTNLAVVALDDGQMCVFTKAAAEVIVDVQATLTGDRTLALVPTEPTRLHDSREPAEP